MTLNLPQSLGTLGVPPRIVLQEAVVVVEQCHRSPHGRLPAGQQFPPQIRTVVRECYSVASFGGGSDGFGTSGLRF